MKATDQKKALALAVEAAKAAGAVMRKNLHLPKRINASQQHDIKLELDVRCQKLIERTLAAGFGEVAGVAVFGEEGTTGDLNSDLRWVVDPIDGTVNFTYGIPHACVSIALQEKTKRGASGNSAFQTVAGVVYDPFTDELFTAIRGGPAKLNGKAIHVSDRAKLEEAIVSVGFAKSTETLDRMLPQFTYLVHRVRKIRIMGAAALAMVYVAAGRFEAYVEGGVRLWDIAAGGLILECAGGEFWNEEIGADSTYRVIANNGKLRRKLQSSEKK
jgi:myo-inositol-1(or 4)-monophosphatase